MTSCTWDYVTYTLANRSYTMMLCCFVFFIPLGIISYCYLFMFLAIRKTSRYTSAQFIIHLDSVPVQCSERQKISKGSEVVQLLCFSIL